MAPNMATPVAHADHIDASARHRMHQRPLIPCDQTLSILLDLDFNITPFALSSAFLDFFWGGMGMWVFFNGVLKVLSQPNH